MQMLKCIILQHLLQPGATIVPYKAVVYCQAVQSTTLRQWHHWDQHPEPCRGVRNPYDIHVERLHGSLDLISEPVEMLTVDFRCPLREQTELIQMVS